MSIVPSPTAAQFADRLFQSSLGFVDIMAAYLGDRLGWYRALRADGPATAGELVARAGGDPRYAREWLEQQAVSGVLRLEPDGRFRLPEGPAEVLTDEHSLSYLAPIARMFGATAAQLPALLGAYRDGGGVSWADFGTDMREAQADINRPLFEQRLAQVLADLPELDAALRRPDARVADVGCGAGWSTIALASAYPQARVEGVDVDAPSIELARANATAAGVAERICLHATGTGELPDAFYDVVFAFECVHDMSSPEAVLSDLRRAVKPDGHVVVVDEAVGEEFAPDGDDVERIMYGYSLLVCLPDGKSSEPTAATGTVMRPATLRGYAQQAGFRDIEVLPAGEFGLFRFYRLLT